MDKIIPYCVFLQYSGKKPFIFGSIPIPENLSQPEIDKEIEIRWREKYREIMPDDLAFPQIIKYLPGQIMFVPRTDT